LFDCSLKPGRSAIVLVRNASARHASVRNRYWWSSSETCIERIALETPAIKLSCVSTTPLGFPVVPDV
jgi:hypothetical protein